MPINTNSYYSIKAELEKQNLALVAVSKTKSIEDIKELYDLGQRDFGENYAQELAGKAKELPADIRWHFIGHLQTNKVKLIARFVQLIQSVDSLKLLKEIDKEAGKAGRIIDCLLQVHIAREETKFGFDEQELLSLDWKAIGELKNIQIKGLMGMASLTADQTVVRTEFRDLKKIFEKLEARVDGFSTLSMGMSSDYKVAVEEGSTMVRIGSLLFGEREKRH